MKIAVCYSGMFRDFLTTVKNHKKMIIDVHDCDVYASFWDVIGHGAVAERYDFKPGDTVTREDINTLTQLIQFKNIEFESFKNFELSVPSFMNELISQPNPKNVLSMYYKIKRAGEMVEKSNIKYDAVIRMRTDIVFCEPLVLREEIKPMHLYTPVNGSWGDDSVGDQFFYGAQKTMPIVYELYDKLKAQWQTPVNYVQPPETILCCYLYERNIQPIKCEKPWVLLSRTLKETEIAHYCN